MASLVAEKIFVDPNEEISFLADRIVNSQKEHFIVIVPSSSVLFTSNLSIKILYRRVIKAEKVVIIVTEDEYGTKIAQKIGFIVVQKVSQITADLWEIANNKVYAAKSSINNKKDELLKNIRGEQPQTKIENKVEEQINESDKISKERKGIPDESTESFEINLSSEDLNSDSDVESKTEAGKNEEISYNNVAQKEEQPKIQEKVKEIGGIKIYSGSDVEDLKGEDKDDTLYSMDDEFMNDRQIDTSAFSNRKFAGRDVTKLTPKKGMFSSVLGGILGTSKKTLRPEDRIDDDQSIVMTKWYQKRGVVMTVIAFILTLLLIYLTIFHFSSIKVEIALESESVVAEETVEIDTEEGLSAVDIDGLIIPGEAIESKEISLSISATANGEGKRGEKATGAVYIFNKSNKDIIVPKGTKITSVRTGLAYEIIEETTLPAAKEASDLSINPSRTDNIRVQAVSFGEDYNVADSEPDSGFSIEDIDELNSQDIKREGDFSGGTTEEYVSVSEENFDDAKDEIKDQIEEQVMDDLKSSVPEGFVLLEESMEFEEVEATSSPEVGDEATKNGDEYIFDLTVVGKATGVMVREKDLTEVIEAVIKSENEDTEDKDLGSITEVNYKNYLKNSNGIYITIFAEGNIVAPLDQDALKNQIKGKTVSKAQEIIDSYEVIKSATIKYFPSVMPGALQYVPRSDSRITLIIK
ncbi:hypothetical protein KC669_02780 [Candidatus Dojkabacteria bacterium]|uniref:Baseplate protein J-like domain-containing protein n=1 Tax=Candidatus Dojkabacteria bacterium TaxID=2099670 RepID=A0A955RLC9_9BACT|nr:hypothetical protein [Candidatus Dojkabacteria bacterium]